MEKSINPRFTKGEEIANAVSHGFGLVFAIVATVLIVVFSSRTHNTWHIVSASIFGFTLILLYTSSTLNHALTHTKAKDIFHNFDQIAIYFLIAGTYTPIALSIIRDDWGWLMFGIEWGLALTGTIIKTLFPNRFERGVNTFIIISYIIMGWMVLFFIIPVMNHMPTHSLWLILIGGGFYSLGVLFFKLEKIPFAHLIWHLFVVAGSVCHWTAIFIYFI
ncbi:MAG TPA: hemolysin D [Marinilabiliales bacterium]|jgi:hemolysin III|nr:hemolysin III family protein [Salinivirgaceae bacterium]OFX43754.1 MAG: hypothetical protein A2W95_02210 [Bacteroidetes bacterium GWA2_40_14]OFX57057.1 MAG: hypothetical protein A2W84_12025 [Bacteroidetes bacterium GWC2_40_13]OFX72183.1 MAG: hypothetical protein A2W96_05745 [Bacteroidetes bacterium GWD2_40_43]OFX94249.1 MAG: hypothetical protein A2W97_18945 [Bacteroidetes bacterium GWE2_40_63]OFY23682.1 MAG: hypothetical protein A2W88_12895 [Bacteroidetes bacterium GWF2_40_13]OFZ25243.1 MA